VGTIELGHPEKVDGFHQQALLIHHPVDLGARLFG
jgi:hypothetical protein